MGDIAYVTSGSTPSKDAFVEKGIPYLKMYNLRRQKIDFAYKQQFIKKEVHNGSLKRCRAYSGDILMNIIKQLNKYIFWFLNEMSEINAINTKGVTGQNNISVTQAQSIKIPLPSLPTQQRIVAKLEQLMAYCDTLEDKHITKSTTNPSLITSSLKRSLATPSESINKKVTMPPQ